MRPERLLLDSCVLIDYLRRRAEAVAYIDALPARAFLPAIVVAELYAGLRSGDERLKVERMIRAFRIVKMNAEIATSGGLLSRQYRASHGVSLSDAIIAATAVATHTKLVTVNARHFPMLPDLIQPY